MFRQKTTFSVCSIILRRPARHSGTDSGPAPIRYRFGTLTLLFNDSHGGLQVRNKAGDYVDAPPLPGAAIVNGKISVLRAALF